MNIESWNEVVRLLALELMFAEAGKDTGLLPVNHLLAQLEEMSRNDPPPGPIREAVGRARQAVDRLFTGDVLFDAASLQELREGNAWMDTALQALQRGRPVPELPAAGSAMAAKPAPTRPAPNPNEPVSATPVAVEDLPLVLHLEQDAELLREFVAESQEHLQNIELGVLVLEDNPTDADTLNSIFRAFHTFKGGSGFLKLTPVHRLAHDLESLLDRARQHRLAIDSAVINLILEGADTLKQFVAEIQAALTAGHAGHIVIPTANLVWRVRAIVASPDRPPVPAGLPDNTPTEPAREPPSAAPALAADNAPVARGKPARPAGEGSIVKVDTFKLDSLMDLVGELVIAQSMVAQDHAWGSLESQRLNRNMAHLTGITRDLQRITMSLRMVPIRPTFQKMQRLVRDLSAKQGKPVELHLRGEDTELDRSVTEEINDPLVHMIRNAMDHGIEKPEVRLARGKPAHGALFLRAFHQGANIVVEVRDDGAGLDRQRILSKGIEKGLVKPGASLTDKEIFDLIFAPGFSTAEQVTDLSGRGVGLDVVRRNVERLRGKVTIASEPGLGATFTLYLPLTLAIIDGFIIGVGKDRFILPTYTVRESFRPTPQMLSSVHARCELVNVRGRLHPLLRLYDYFGVDGRAKDPTEGILLLVEHDGDARCLLADQLLGKQEVVIKNLGDTFKQSQAIAGAAILGDGRVGLILDVSTLVKLQAAPLARAA